MSQVIPLRPLEFQVLSMISRAEAVSWETLLGRFEGKCDAAELERICESFKRNRLIEVTTTTRAHILSITREGTYRANQEVLS